MYKVWYFRDIGSFRRAFIDLNFWLYQKLFINYKYRNYVIIWNKYYIHTYVMLRVPPTDICHTSCINDFPSISPILSHFYTFQHDNVFSWILFYSSSMLLSRILACWKQHTCLNIPRWQSYSQEELFIASDGILGGYIVSTGISKV